MQANMPEKNYFLSQQKFDELKKELDYLKTTERKKNAESLEYAKSLGDLSENAEYHEARDRQADVEDRIAEIEEMIKYGKIVEGHTTETVEFGATVKTKRSDNDREENFTIVGAEESDMLAGKISHESPLGSALLGHKKGETISVRTPKGEISYKIIDIQ